MNRCPSLETLWYSSSERQVMIAVVDTEEKLAEAVDGTEAMMERDVIRLVRSTETENSHANQ